MKLRQFMIYAHLIIGSLFLPLLLLMPLTGSLYIWGYGGETVKTEVFRVAEVPPEGEAAQTVFFNSVFKDNSISYKFESIRARDGDFTFRPSSRTHYAAKIENGGLTFYRLDPNFLKRINELHTGHGPVVMRWFQAIFGIMLILVALSGVWLAYTAKAYRQPMLISFAFGVTVIVMCLI